MTSMDASLTLRSAALFTGRHGLNRLLGRRKYDTRHSFSSLAHGYHVVVHLLHGSFATLDQLRSLTGL